MIKVLSSNSQGNSYVIKSSTETLLLEARIPFKNIKKELNFDLSNIIGCIYTHSHSDHSNRHISYNDKTLTISEWSKIIGISSNALSKRISKWGIERALSTIPINNITLYEYNGETHNLAEWCNILNLEYTTIHSRIKKHNWSINSSFSTFSPLISVFTSSMSKL